MWTPRQKSRPGSYDGCDEPLLLSYLRRFVAWVLSFRKRDWSVRDYPVRLRRQSSPPLWLAQIHGWWVIGSGETREDALADLQKLLDDHRQRDGALPRPGVSVPLELAPFEFMSRNADLARDFFPPILGVDYDDCLITDQSSVWDFPS